MSREDGFLSRWSRRKLQEKEAAEPATPAETADDFVASEDAVADVARTDLEPALTEEELAALPKVEELTPGSDFKPFLRPGVPAELRRAAMRRMWTLNPTISTYLDVARDYAYDWNTPGGVPGHGGALDLEEVARTVDRFLRRSADTPAAERDEPPLEDASPTEVANAVPVESPADRQSPPPASGPAEDRVPPSDETFVEGAGLEQKSPAPKPPPRRHGGAIPR